MVAVLCFIGFSSALVHGQTDRAASEHMWQQVMEAKGASAMTEVQRLRVVYFTSGLLAPVPRARQVVMAELPNRWWWYVEEPHPLGDSLRNYDLTDGSGWSWSESTGPAARPRKRGASDNGEAIRDRTLEIFFGALDDFHPEPISATTVQRGLIRRDQIRLRWKQYNLVYELDRQTHLPVSLDVQWTAPPHDVSWKGAHPGSRHIEEHTFDQRFEMRNYHAVQGIQLPGRVRAFGVWNRAEVEINPRLNSALFTEAPKPIEGREGWRRFVADQP